MSSIPSKPRTVKPATTPATGTVRWTFPLDDSGRGSLVILDAQHNGVDYAVRDTGTADPAYARRVYTMENTLSGAVYQIAVMEPDGRWECDCPDAVYHPERPGGCKHARALKAALASIGRLPAPAAEPLDPEEYHEWLDSRTCVACGNLSRECSCGPEAEACGQAFPDDVDAA